MRCSECDFILFSDLSKETGRCQICRDGNEDSLANWQAKELDEQLYSFQTEDNAQRAG